MYILEGIRLNKVSHKPKTNIRKLEYKGHYEIRRNYAIVITQPDYNSSVSHPIIAALKYFKKSQQKLKKKNLFRLFFPSLNCYKVSFRKYFI